MVGFSDGGITALRMAAQADTRVDRLVAIGTDKMLKPDDPVRKLLAGVTAESWTKKFPETVALYQRAQPASPTSRAWSMPSCRCGWTTAPAVTPATASGR